MGDEKKTTYEDDEEQTRADVDWGNPGESAITHALLLVAEQLKLANLIKLGLVKSEITFGIKNATNFDSYVAHPNAREVGAMLGVNERK